MPLTEEPLQPDSFEFTVRPDFIDTHGIPIVTFKPNYFGQNNDVETTAYIRLPKTQVEIDRVRATLEGGEISQQRSTTHGGEIIATTANPEEIILQSTEREEPTIVEIHSMTTERPPQEEIAFEDHTSPPQPEPEPARTIYASAVTLRPQTQPSTTRFSRTRFGQPDFRVRPMVEREFIISVGKSGEEITANQQTSVGEDSVGESSNQQRGEYIARESANHRKVDSTYKATLANQEREFVQTANQKHEFAPVDFEPANQQESEIESTNEATRIKSVPAVVSGGGGPRRRPANSERPRHRKPTETPQRGLKFLTG